MNARTRYIEKIAICSVEIYLKVLHVSHFVRKLVFAICEQQMRRSACASAQSDRRLCFRCLYSIISILAISKISRLQLVSVAEQTGLSLTWSQTPKTGIFKTWLMYFLAYSSGINA